MSEEEISRLQLTTKETAFWAEIDAHQITDAQALFAQMAVALQFPDYFGCNWDALNDCLSDLSWLPHQKVIVVLKDIQHLQQGLPKVFETLSVVYSDASEYLAKEGRTLLFINR